MVTSSARMGAERKARRSGVAKDRIRIVVAESGGFERGLREL